MSQLANQRSISVPRFRPIHSNSGLSVPISLQFCSNASFPRTSAAEDFGAQVWGSNPCSATSQVGPGARVEHVSDTQTHTCAVPAKAPILEYIYIGRSAMPKPPSNHGKRWTPGDKSKLRDLAKGNTPTRVIGLKLGRTEDAVQGKASHLNVSLKPTNQSPYNREQHK